MANEASDLIAAAETLYDESLSPGATKQIRRLLEAGIARASGLLANIIMCDYLNHWNDAGQSNLTDADEAVQTALRLADDIAIAHYAQGFIYRARGNHEQALAAFGESLKCHPTSVRTRAQMAAEFMYLGRFSEALGEIDLAIADSSGHKALGMFNWIKGRTLFFMSRYAEAIPCLQESIETWQDLWYNRLYLVSAQAYVGNKLAASVALDEFKQSFPAYATVRDVVAAEQTNPMQNPDVVKGREAFHAGLVLAGMPS